MFQRKFANDGGGYNVFNAVSFRSQLSQRQVIRTLLKMGVPAFLSPDSDKLQGYHTVYYKDGRITGIPSYANRASCCSFTKDNGNWYLFPISDTELKNVGLTGDDLIHWIKCLNESKMGFKYSYLGVHSVDIQANSQGVMPSWAGKNANTDNTKRYPDGTAHFILVPTFPSLNIHKPYLHWICLRYLIGSYVGGGASSMFKYKPKTSLAYYNIPRVVMMLHEDYNLPFHKAFLYAQTANVWYSALGFGFTDYMGYVGGIGTGHDYKSYPAPCLNLTAKEFKEIWNSGISGNMNGMFTINNPCLKNIDFIARTGIKDLSAPYDYQNLYKLFDEGKYANFIEEIQKSYKPLKKKVSVKKRKKAATLSA